MLADLQAALASVAADPAGPCCGAGRRGQAFLRRAQPEKKCVPAPSRPTLPGPVCPMHPRDAGHSRRCRCPDCRVQVWPRRAASWWPSATGGGGGHGPFRVNGIDVGLFCATPSDARCHATCPQTSDGNAADRRFHHRGRALARGTGHRVVLPTRWTAMWRNSCVALLAKPAVALAMASSFLPAERNRTGSGLPAGWSDDNLQHDAPRPQGGVALIDKRAPSWRG